MKIVLTKDHKDLGKAMDVLTIKDGFARNFLIPNGIAVPATEGNMKRVAEAKRNSELTEGKKDRRGVSKNWGLRNFQAAECE